MNWKIYGVFFVALMLSLWRISSLGGALALEESEHKTTKQALAKAIKKGKGWEAAYGKSIEAIETTNISLQSCFEREADALKDSRDRQAILDSSKPQERTQAETRQVVDDETRRRAIDRLNRPF